MKLDVLVRTLAERGIRLSRSGDRLRVAAPPGRITAELREALARHKPALLTLLDDGVPTLGPRDLGESAPLSFSQERMWVAQHLDPRGTAYNMGGATLLEGPLDLDRLENAMDEVLRRHHVVHSRFVFRDGRPRAVTGPPQRFDAVRFDVSHLPESDRLPAATDRLSEIFNAPYDLETGPLVRIVHARLDHDRHVLGLGMHHIVSDLLSLIHFGESVRQAYEVPGSVASSPPLEVQYRDFAAWQREWFESGILQGQRDYWHGRLKGLPTLDLALDHPRPAILESEGGATHTRLPAAFLRDLRQFAAQEGATEFMVLLAAFFVLLHQRSGQVDLAVAVPVSHRIHPSLQSLVGTFVNTVVHRNDLSGAPTFRELVARVRTTALEAFEHQEMPFEVLVNELQKGRDGSRPPLVQVLFNMVRIPERTQEPGYRAEDLPLRRNGAQFELDFNVMLEPDGARIHLTYNASLFAPATAESMVTHYASILRRGMEDPDLDLEGLSAVVPSERARLERVNRRGEPFPRRPLHALVADQAARTPDRIALVTDEGSLTYAALLEAAGRVSAALGAMGVEPGDRVVILMERGRDLVPGLLGILGAGAAYVPVDPGYPETRVEFMARQSGAVAVVSHRDLHDRFDLGLPVLDLDRWMPPAPRPFVDVPADSPAYVIYTSGTTGTPKGVAVPHRALANFLTSMAAEPGLSPDDRLLAITTISFDIAVLELYLPLTLGARVVLATERDALDGHRLAGLMDDEDVSVLQATPATWKLLLAAGWEGRKGLRALCGGEPLPPALADRLRPVVGELWNMYGPTEATVWSTLQRVEAGEPILIGRPIANTSVYVVGPGGQPTPVGVPGELWIGGEGVALGYHGRPELTAERFLDAPFHEGEAVYRTGDLVRMRHDGRLEHLGRLDHQVKVRGFRIELGEVESCLRALDGVADAVVAARDDRLVAYLVPQGAEVRSVDLRRWVAGRLPGYMMPSAFVSIDRLPLTPNGKVDRKALPDPQQERGAERAGRPPRGPREELVAAVWASALDLPAVGATDNFFDLGGHSLLAMQVVTDLEERTGMRIDPRALFFLSLAEIATSLPEPEPVS